MHMDHVLEKRSSEMNPPQHSGEDEELPQIIPGMSITSQYNLLTNMYHVHY